MGTSWLNRVLKNKSGLFREGRHESGGHGWRPQEQIRPNNGRAFPTPEKEPYVLETGEAAAYRLGLLQRLYGPGTHQLLSDAGLRPGMRVADVGCGIGTVTAMLGDIIGAEGHVVGFDVSPAQLDEARQRLTSGATNLSFVEASAIATGWAEASFDLVYCRFLLLHLPEPHRALHEMMRLLKPGGILVCEDGDLTSAGSEPPSALDAFADLFGKLSPMRGVDYTLGRRLYQIVLAAGFEEAEVRYNQPVVARGECKRLLELSVAEAGPAFLDSGLVTAAELDETISEMHRLATDDNVLAVMPRMSQVWARKPELGSHTQSDWDSRIEQALAS